MFVFFHFVASVLFFPRKNHTIPSYSLNVIVSFANLIWIKAFCCCLHVNKIWSSTLTYQQKIYVSRSWEKFNMSYRSKVSLWERVSFSELVIRTEQQGLFVVPAGAEVAMAAGEGWPCTSIQCGLLGVLLICRGKVMDGVLDHVTWIHRFLQAAGNALHWGTATWRLGRGEGVQGNRWVRKKKKK